jgi:acetylornithine aminotransferase
MVNEHQKYMLATYARPPPVFVKGEGSYLYDLENRKYLDFTSGIAVNGLGHSDPGTARIIADQVSRILLSSDQCPHVYTSTALDLDH